MTTIRVHFTADRLLELREQLERAISDWSRVSLTVPEFAVLLGVYEDVLAGREPHVGDVVLIDGKPRSVVEVSFPEYRHEALGDVLAHALVVGSDPPYVLRDALRAAGWKAPDDAEGGEAALREFVQHTLDEYGERMPSQWTAHARSLLGAG